MRDCNTTGRRKLTNHNSGKEELDKRHEDSAGASKRKEGREKTSPKSTSVAGDIPRFLDSICIATTKEFLREPGIRS